MRRRQRVNEDDELRNTTPRTMHRRGSRRAAVLRIPVRRSCRAEHNRFKTFAIRSGPHRMHEMRTVTIDDPVAWCVSVSLSVTRLHRAKTAGRIEVKLGVNTPAMSVMSGVARGPLGSSRTPPGVRGPQVENLWSNREAAQGTITL